MKTKSFIVRFHNTNSSHHAYLCVHTLHTSSQSRHNFSSSFEICTQNIFLLSIFIINLLRYYCYYSHIFYLFTPHEYSTDIVFFCSFIFVLVFVHESLYFYVISHLGIKWVFFHTGNGNIFSYVIIFAENVKRTIYLFCVNTL